MNIRTYAWPLEAPNDIEHATLTLPDAEVRGYVARLEAAAREQGFSFAAYDEGVLPWALLWFYSADTGRSGVHCGHPDCITPIGTMP